MRRIQLLFAVGAGLLAVVIAGGQATNTGVLSEALRVHLQDERFEVVTSVRGLPLGVRDELQELFGGLTLDIAEPGAPFQATASDVNGTLPTRRLIAAGCSKDHHCVVYYERGGKERTWHVALFHWSPALTRLEAGGVASSGLKSIEDVRNDLVSARIDSSAKFW